MPSYPPNLTPHPSPQSRPNLQAVLHDPIPEVRSTGAKALGRLCAGLGEEHFPQLLPWLLASLSKEGSAVCTRGLKPTG